MTEIYRCCADTLESGYDLTAKEEKLIECIRDQIERAVPDLAERIESLKQEAEQTMQGPTM